MAVLAHVAGGQLLFQVRPVVRPQGIHRGGRLVAPVLALRPADTPDHVEAVGEVIGPSSQVAPGGRAGGARARACPCLG